MVGSYRRGYCSTCDADRLIVRTVDWQEDACVRCGWSVIEEPAGLLSE